MKIKANKNINILDQDKDIQKPDKNVVKIDDIIKNGKIPSKYEFKKNKRNSSENKKNQLIFNNIINNYINNEDNNDNNNNYMMINKENGLNRAEIRENYSNNYSNKKYMKDIKDIKDVKDIKDTKYNKKNNNNEIDDLNIDNYVSKYNNIEIKDDDDYRELSSIHEKLINNILKEEDIFIGEHKAHIDNMVESIKDEMKYLHEVDKPGSDIEEYTSNLDKLLLNEIKTITQLRIKLNKFRIMLKDEETLANIFDDDLKIQKKVLMNKAKILLLMI